MRSIERKFNKTIKGNPNWSSYLCFLETIKSKKFNKQTISRWFNKLVDPNDYCKKDKKDIVGFLYSLSNNTEDNQKQGKIAQQSLEK